MTDAAPGPTVPRPVLRKPYIIFTRLDDSSRTRLEPLLRLRADLVRAAVPRSRSDVVSDPADGSVVWRLFNAQHHLLCAGATFFDALESAREEAVLASRDRELLLADRTGPDRTGRFGWTLTTRTGLPVVPLRLFDSGYDRNRHLDATITALAGVEIALSLDAKVIGHVEDRRAGYTLGGRAGKTRLPSQQ